MLATMDMMMLLDEAEALVYMISDSEIAEEYREAKLNLQNDSEAQQLIQKFLNKKDSYDEVQRFGRYHPDYKTVINEIMEIQREIDLNNTISRFKQAEEALETLLQTVCQSLAGQVSPSIKVPTGNPFFDKGCSGGCGSGGACGCH